jgi:threonine dehydrogenase-like Zn-dependent dehydrogenase
MRAAIMKAPFKMEVGTWKTPEAGPGEVLVSVRAAGVCAGDLYFYLGKNPYAVYPQVCGHEISGVVEKLGEGVKGLRTGTPVVVEPFIGCGTCYPCRSGKSNCCVNLRIIGVHQPGGYAEYLTAPATHVHPIPEGLSFFDASFTEPTAIGVHACRRGQVSAEDTVLVLGCGPIGLTLIEVIKSRGANVIAADLLEDRLRTAREFGADTLIADDTLPESIMDKTNGEGAPVVMEATGDPKAMERAAELVAAGGRIVIVGLLKEGVPVSFPGLDFTRREMSIMGSRASVNCFPEALKLLAKGNIHNPKLATRFSLWDAPEVFADLYEHPGSKQKGVFVIEDK